MCTPDSTLRRAYPTFPAYSMFFSSHLPGAVSLGYSSPAVVPGSYQTPTWAKKGKKRLTWLDYNELAILLYPCSHHFSFLQKEKCFQSVSIIYAGLSHLMIPLYLLSHEENVIAILCVSRQQYTEPLSVALHYVPSQIAFHMCVGKTIKSILSLSPRFPHCGHKYAYIGLLVLHTIS